MAKDRAAIPTSKLKQLNKRMQMTGPNIDHGFPQPPEVGSGAVGQLLVWEWRSETYVARTVGMGEVGGRAGQIETSTSLECWLPSGTGNG